MSITETHQGSPFASPLVPHYKKGKQAIKLNVLQSSVWAHKQLGISPSLKGEWGRVGVGRGWRAGLLTRGGWVGVENVSVGGG